MLTFFPPRILHTLHGALLAFFPQTLDPVDVCCSCQPHSHLFCFFMTLRFKLGSVFYTDTSHRVVVVAYNYGLVWFVLDLSWPMITAPMALLVLFKGIYGLAEEKKCGSQYEERDIEVICTR
jgi:hypothetical protein